jgi:hypothetical protein
LLLLLLGPVRPAVAEPRELRFGWRSGLELRYRLAMDARTTVTLGERSSTSSLRTSLHLTQRILAVAADGAARILTRVESGRTSSEDGPARVMPPREGTMRMDARGNLLDGSLLEAGVAPLQLVFPARPLAIGDSWYNSLPPSEEIPVPIRVRYTLVRPREESGLSCLELAILVESAAASAVDAPMHLEVRGAGTVLFAPAEGILVSSRVSADLLLGFDQPTAEGLLPARARTSLDMRLEYRP